MPGVLGGIASIVAVAVASEGIKEGFAAKN